jgi:hypothetical protein
MGVIASSEPLRRSILAAAADLLQEPGFETMTMDAVVARACQQSDSVPPLAQQGALAMDAFMAEVDADSPFPDTGLAVEDIRQSVHATVALFTRPRLRQMLLAVIFELQTDRELRDAYRERYVRPRGRQNATALRRGIDRGELRPDLHLDVLFDEIYGAINFRLITGATLDHDLVDQLISHAFAGAHAFSGAR